MANIILQKPAAGQSISHTPQAEDILVFEFTPGDAQLERVEDNLVASFEDGSSIVLTDFYIAYTAENMPEFLIEGETVPGEAFFAALGEELMPAAGGNTTPQGSGTSQGFESGTLLGGIDRTSGLDQDNENTPSLQNISTRSISDNNDDTIVNTIVNNIVNNNVGNNNNSDNNNGDSDNNVPPFDDVPTALADEVKIIARATHNGNDFNEYFNKGADAAGGKFILVDANGNPLTPSAVNTDGTITYELWGLNGSNNVNWGSVTFDPATGKYSVEADGGWVPQSQMEFEVAFVDGDGDQSESVTFDVSEFGGVTIREANLESGTNPDTGLTTKTWSPPAGYTIDASAFKGGTFEGDHGEIYTVTLNAQGQLVFELLTTADNPAAGESAETTYNHWVSINKIDVPLLDQNNERHDITVNLNIEDDGILVSGLVEKEGNRYEADLTSNSAGIVDLSQVYNIGADGAGKYSFMNANTDFKENEHGQTQYNFAWGFILLDRDTGEMTYTLNADYKGPAPEVEVYMTDSEGDVASHVHVTLNPNTSTSDSIGGQGDDIVLGKSNQDNILLGDGQESHIDTTLKTAITDLQNADTDTLRAEKAAALSKHLESLEHSSDGNDILYGDAGSNLLAGLDGDDKIYGSKGDEILVGGSGNDILRGGSGKDILIGGKGDDLLVLDINDIFVDAGSSENDLDTLLGEGKYNTEDILDVMKNGDIELAVYGTGVSFTGQNTEELLKQLEISKNNSGQISLGKGWEESASQNSDYRQFILDGGTDKEITILVESLKLTTI